MEIIGLAIIIVVGILLFRNYKLLKSEEKKVQDSYNEAKLLIDEVVQNQKRKQQKETQQNGNKETIRPTETQK